METYYEVREVQPAGSPPQTRGAIISLHRTFAEAMAKAKELTARGRNVTVNRSE